jgi:anaerobic selenocysteine-containing dehydrogenase
MSISRRDFLAAGAAGAGLLALPSSARTILKPKPRKLLVLGGTGFLGPHFVEIAARPIRTNSPASSSTTSSNCTAIARAI